MVNPFNSPWLLPLLASFFYRCSPYLLPSSSLLLHADYIPGSSTIRRVNNSNLGWNGLTTETRSSREAHTTRSTFRKTRRWTRLSQSRVQDSHEKHTM